MSTYKLSSDDGSTVSFPLFAILYDNLDFLSKNINRSLLFPGKKVQRWNLCGINLLDFGTLFLKQQEQGPTTCSILESQSPISGAGKDVCCRLVDDDWWEEREQVPRKFLQTIPQSLERRLD